MNHQLRKDRKKIGGLDRDFEDRFDFETNCACKLFPSSMTKIHIKRKKKEQVRCLKENCIRKDFLCEVEYEKEWEREGWNCVCVWRLTIKPLRHSLFYKVFLRWLCCCCEECDYKCVGEKSWFILTTWLSDWTLQATFVRLQIMQKLLESYFNCVSNALLRKEQLIMTSKRIMNFAE